MQVNIWSDVRCPFCYIGKHKFEKALEKFPHKDELDIKWHSFELDPNLKTEPEINAVEHLAKNKGISKEQAQQMMNVSVQMGKEVGIEFNFDQSVVANSFHAHRLIQFAQSRGLGNEIEEILFQAHFEEGKNIDDKTVLKENGLSVGLKEIDLDQVLFTDAYTKEVNEDKQLAKQLNIQGVPFFVFNKKYAVSGAQPEEMFLETLENSWKEFNDEQAPLIVNEGKSCSTEGNCD